MAPRGKTKTGWQVAHAKKTQAELEILKRENPSSFCGVEQSHDMLRWIWSNFSAVAGDQPTFECWPSGEDWTLHEVLLSGWGCPIGELFDLEALAVRCRAEDRWSFFVTSEVCCVHGGVSR
jgi:hypothetical protein